MTARSAALAAHLIAEARDVARRRVPPATLSSVPLPCGLHAIYLSGTRVNRVRRPGLDVLRHRAACRSRAARRASGIPDLTRPTTSA